MRKRAFTLLELLVAITIFSIVAAAAYALFDSSRRLSSRAEARARLFQSARAALRAIEDDVRGAVLTGTAFDTGLLGTNGGTDNQPRDRFEVFAVNAHTPLSAILPVGTAGRDQVVEPRCDLTQVTYWIEEPSSKNARGLVRFRERILTPAGGAARTDEDIEEVCAEVTALNLRYYDGGWKDSWDSLTQGRLPLAVEVTVRVRVPWRGDDEIVENFTTRIYLAVGAETPQPEGN